MDETDTEELDENNNEIDQIYEFDDQIHGLELIARNLNYIYGDSLIGAAGLLCYAFFWLYLVLAVLEKIRYQRTITGYGHWLDAIILLAIVYARWFFVDLEKKSSLIILPSFIIFDNLALFLEGRMPKKVTEPLAASVLYTRHADVFDFMNSKKSMGKEQRARELFYALWFPALFTNRVESDAEWSLMCSHDCPNLFEVLGEEFEKFYKSYENVVKFQKRTEAYELWKAKESMYYAMLDASCELVQKFRPYESYFGSSVSRGVPRCDSWHLTPTDTYDRQALKEKIARNSLFFALTPTASMAQILGNNVSIEPYAFNIYSHRVLPREVFKSLIIV